MKKEFPSTPGEAFEAIVDGAYYGTEMANLRAAGRICDFSLERQLPVFTFWDIGLSDYTSVWLIQPVGGRWFLVLDWAEFEGVPASGMVDKMVLWERKWQKPIHTDFLPHDADVRSKNDAKSYAQVIREGGRNVKVVPRTPDVFLGIGYVRDVLPHCWFHKTHCDTSRNRDGTPHEPSDTQEEFPSGIACLEGYQKEVSPTSAILREKPKHDLFSHSADAFRTFAEAWRRGMVNADSVGTHKPRAIGGARPSARR